MKTTFPQNTMYKPTTNTNSLGSLCNMPHNCFFSDMPQKTCQQVLSHWNDMQGAGERMPAVPVDAATISHCRLAVKVNKVKWAHKSVRAILP